MRVKVKGVKKHFLGKVIHLNQMFLYHVFVRWIKHFFKAHIIHVKHHTGKFDRPVVIVANHTSGWDPFFILSCTPKSVVFDHPAWRFPTSSIFFERVKHIYARYFLHWIGAYPIRKANGDLQKSLSGTLDIIERGQNVIFFPEGKKVGFADKPEARKGIGHLVKSSSIYILPIYIHYSKRGKNGKGARLGRSCVVIGDVIKSEHFAEKFHDEIRHHEVMKEVYKLSVFKDKYFLDGQEMKIETNQELIFNKQD